MLLHRRCRSGTAVHDVETFGLADIRTPTTPGTARFASAADLVATGIGGSPGSERIDTDTTARISAGVTERLGRHGDPGGLGLPLHCHVVVAGRP